MALITNLDEFELVTSRHPGSAQRSKVKKIKEGILIPDLKTHKRHERRTKLRASKKFNNDDSNSQFKSDSIEMKLNFSNDPDKENLSDELLKEIPNILLTESKSSHQVNENVSIHHIVHNENIHERLQQKKKETLQKILETQQKIKTCADEYKNYDCMIAAWDTKYFGLVDWEINHEIDLKNSNVTLLTKDIENLLLEKHPIVCILIKRSQLRGEESLSGNIPSNIDTKRIDNNISTLQRRIDEIKEEIDELRELKSEKNYKYKKNEIIRKQVLVHSQMLNLTNILNMDKDTEHEINKLILEEEMRSRYQVYAETYKIEYDKDDDFDLFRQSNRHFHWRSLDGRATNTKCYNKYSQCREKVVLSCNNYNTFTVDDTCSCGFHKWKYEHPPDDLTKYNLESNHVYGNTY